MSVYVETDCTIEHDGRTFEAGGAYVTDDHLIAYVNNDGVLQDWHGRTIGTWREVSSWPVQSCWGSRMYAIRATVNGITYSGRGFGIGMILKARRMKNQPR